MTGAQFQAQATAVIAIVGPTATGKSELAIRLAQHLGGEIVNADSMQLYAGMNIGTAKVPVAERGDIVHHLLDIWPLSKSAAVAEYQQLARQRIAEISARGRLPILVGGSGLYLRGALDKLDFPGESPQVRARLTAEAAALGTDVLHQRLRRLDPVAADKILATNTRRVIRALEVIEITGHAFTATMPDFCYVYRAVQIGLDRADLDDRVGLRVSRMVEQGLLAELRALLPLGLRDSPTAGKALGYAQLLRVLDDSGLPIGDIDEALEITVRATRRFVRRQRSWFRRDPRVHWFDAAGPALTRRALDLVADVVAPRPAAGLRTHTLRR